MSCNQQPQHDSGKESTVAHTKEKKSILKSIMNSNPSADKIDREARMRNNYEPSIFDMNITKSSTIRPAHQVVDDTPHVTAARDTANRRVGMVNIGEVGVGDVAPDFELEDTLFIKHRLSSYRGRKILLSFFRFAAWPICTYNRDAMQKQYDMMKKAGILVISIFSSTPEAISQFASESIGEGMLALSDRNNRVYKQYKLNKSKWPKAFISGQADGITGWRKKYSKFCKFSKSYFKDSMKGGTLRPADILINEEGIIVDMFKAYETPKHQHMPFERIEAFIPESKRCKCNQNDCISPKCRQNWKEKEIEQTAAAN